MLGKVTASQVEDKQGPFQCLNMCLLFISLSLCVSVCVCVCVCVIGVETLHQFKIKVSFLFIFNTACLPLVLSFSLAPSLTVLLNNLKSLLSERAVSLD